MKKERRQKPWYDRHELDENGCWIWQGYTSRNGYGQRQYDGRVQYAHRAYYQHYVGPIPDGLCIDHLCGVRSCVNPQHLDPVTMRENVVMRSNSASGLNLRKTHCKNGHEYTEENTTPGKTKYGTTSRSCRACSNDRSRVKRADAKRSDPDEYAKIKALDKIRGDRYRDRKRRGLV